MASSSSSSVNDTFPLINPTEHLAALSPPPMVRTRPPPPISDQYDFEYMIFMEDLSGVASPWSTTISVVN